jgi:hypothetical protein
MARLIDGQATILPVAVKVVKPGMDTQQVIARFEAEQWRAKLPRQDGQ